MSCPQQLRLVPILFTISAGAWGFAADLPARPNIVLIYTDDQGFGDASCLNPDSKIQTPNLDRLAREGVSFTDAHSSDTVCTPSRYGLLTGRYSWRTTLKRGVFGAERKCLIDDDRVTIASLLKNAGYGTAMVGKWHLGMDFPGDVGNRDWTKPVLDMPLDKGFDYFYGIPASMNYGVLAWFQGRFGSVPPTQFTAKKPNKIAISDYRIMPPYQDTAERVKEVLGVQGMEVAPDFVDAECLTRFTDKAIEWLSGVAHDAQHGKPFFLYLPYTSPHKPVIPLPEFRGKSDAGAYGDFVIETDFHVGRVLDFLDQHQLADDTLVIFSSDNGPENTWRQRIEQYQHDSSHLYKGGKRSVYEGGHRVPFFVRWPNGIKKPGRSWGGVICQTDILATIAGLIGVDLPEDAGEDSQSFLDVLRDQAPPKRQPTIHHAANGRFAVRLGEWKLVMPHRNAPIELYDLQSDPAETLNVAGSNMDMVTFLTTRITQIVCDGRTRPGEFQPNDTEYWDDLSWIDRDEYAAIVTKGLGSDVGAVPKPVRKAFELDDHYQKYIDVYGLPLVGSERVSDAALREAAWIVRRMVGHRPDILKAMANNGTRLSVMAWNEYTTDVPEHRHLKPAVYWNRRARGLGATKSAPAVSCAEENILCHPGDPYSTENICIHEFAHAIHSMGMPDVDPTFDGNLQQAFERATSIGLWRGTYAATNREEYWAEGVQSWFDDNRENDSLHNHVNTRAELKEFDPPLARLCQQVFGDGDWRYRKPMLRAAAERAHLRDIDFDKLPKFRWKREPIPEIAKVRIRTELGAVELELYSTKAPQTVANFLHYVHQGLYADGLFHRTVTLDNQPTNDVKIQVIQAQADLERQDEFPAAIPLERTSVTGIRHEDGTISMAREAEPDSGRDHFFICVGDQPELDFGGRRDTSGQGFAAFGKVVNGMDVVRKIHAAAAEGQTLNPGIRIQRAIRLN